MSQNVSVKNLVKKSKSPLDVLVDNVLSYRVHYCGALRSFCNFLLWKDAVSPTLSCGWESFWEEIEGNCKSFPILLITTENVLFIFGCNE